MRARWHSGLALLIATVLMLTSVGSVAAQDAAPRWNLQKGQVFDLVVQQDIRQIVRMHGMMGLPMALRKQENTGTLLFNAEHGRLTSVKARTNLTMEMDAGGQRVEQDMVGDTTITLTPRVP